VTAEVTRGAHASTASGLGFCPSRVRTKTCPLFQSPVGATCIPRDCHWEIVVPDLRPSRIRFEFLPPRVRTKTCPLFSNHPSVPLASLATASGLLGCNLPLHSKKRTGFRGTMSGALNLHITHLRQLGNHLHAGRTQLTEQADTISQLSGNLTGYFSP
jgi:hypothetical protein